MTDDPTFCDTADELFQTFEANVFPSTLIATVGSLNLVCENGVASPSTQIIIDGRPLKGVKKLSIHLDIDNPEVLVNITLMPAPNKEAND